MSKIKFKAWSGHKMSSPFNPLQGMMWNRDTMSEITYLQFTGLSDKKGVEIYEGDIVTNKTKKFSGNGFRGKDLTMVVEWDSDECFYRLSMFDGEGYFGYKKLTKSSASDVEVIGNVYENPELVR